MQVNRDLGIGVQERGQDRGHMGEPERHRRASRTSPRGVADWAVASASAASPSARMRPALTAAARPTSLKASRREVRWNRLAPSRASSLLTALETVAFERLRSAAARANDPVSATLAKMAQASRSGRRGMTMLPKRGVWIVSLYPPARKPHILSTDQP